MKVSELLVEIAVGDKVTWKSAGGGVAQGERPEEGLLTKINVVQTAFSVYNDPS